METRWYDCGSGYHVLAMDPATSGVTWVDVNTILNDPAQALPPTVYKSEPWGYEDGHDPANLDLVAQNAHIEMCRVETIRLAELAFAPATTPTVTLNS